MMTTVNRAPLCFQYQTIMFYQSSINILEESINLAIALLEGGNIDVQV